MGSLPFCYLWILIHHPDCQIKSGNALKIDLKKAKLLDVKLMSYWGRLLLINSVMISLLVLLLSFFEVPIGVRKISDFYRSRFFWKCDEVKTKYRLARWDIICRSKDGCGLGIKNFEVKIKCFLSKWLFRLSIETAGTWIQILHNKHLQSKILAKVPLSLISRRSGKG